MTWQGWVQIAVVAALITALVKPLGGYIVRNVEGGGRVLRGTVERVRYRADTHVPRVFVPWISVEGMFDTAFEQIRHYAANDAVVSLRLLRAISDIGGTLQHSDIRAQLLQRARRVVEGCSDGVAEADAARLQGRLTNLELRLAL